MRFTLLVSLLSIGLYCTSCVQELQDIPEEVVGLAPMYQSDNWDQISLQDPQSIQQLGKLYHKSPYLYATDRGRGIHIFDNTDPESPIQVAFIKIAGNADLAIKNNLLYANNVRDLVTLDISNLDSVSVVHRQVDAFQLESTAFPSSYFGYFECADPERGAIVGWYETTLYHPQCWK